MANKITVDREQLYQTYKQVEAAFQSLQFIMAELGCIHANSIDRSTFVDKGRGVKVIYCPDCGETFEEDLTDGMGI